ncbi:DUF1833 family protein [Methylobacterium sp. Leaf88]|uniref:DUF1833 family protein n=1 Tax=Methylobacterium sp. Leaf88 TaxID=1736244 RepID=UPI0006FD7AB0|nr:DUF1833 family protein [Methylobacterium sp. Leaf88]KQO76419.1 hypothetical protein ASF20_13810 [Methylobacterium sp. Leaf88]
MPNVVSLHARLAANEDQTDQVPVVLVTIRHPSLSAPAYLSSDPTVRISADPLVYGTRHQGIVYPFVLMGAVLPDDEKDSPPKTTLTLENVDSDMAKAIRSITPGTYATVDMTVVLAGTPDIIEARYTNLRSVRGSYDAAQVSLDISAEPLTAEPWPAGRMTVSRFPGLFAA